MSKPQPLIDISETGQLEPNAEQGLVKPDGSPTKEGWRAISRRFQMPMSHKTMTEQGREYSYVTARQVAERLDQVVGSGNWRTLFKVIDAERHIVECSLLVFDVVKQDVGYPNAETDRQRDMEAEPFKSAYSDAFKRAAVMWGIGRYLYGDT